MSKIVEFLRDESGASAAEYALILAIVGVGIVVAAGTLRDAISGAMTNAATKINTSSTLP
jgi:pilus assembly protein Flp/PilA